MDETIFRVEDDEASGRAIRRTIPADEPRRVREETQRLPEEDPHPRHGHGAGG